MLTFDDNTKKGMITIDNEQYNFIHKNGGNYFDIETICSLLGTSQRNANYHANKYLKNTEFCEKNLCMNLKTGKKGRERKLYSLDVIKYIAYRVNSKEAIMYYDLVAQTLNEKFNKIFEIEELPAAMSVIGSDIINKK